MTKNTTPNDARAADSARRIADGRSAPSAARAKYVISAPENKEREGKFRLAALVTGVRALWARIYYRTLF